MHSHHHGPGCGFGRGLHGIPEAGCQAAGRGGPRGGRGGHGSHGGHGFGFDGDDGDLSRGRKFSADDLQLICLSLLGDEPCHGYDLIRLIATRTNGFYKPSPGVIYPALTYLEETGQIAATAEGARKRYALTDAGRAQLESDRERAQWLLARLERFAQKMTLIRRAFEQGATDENGQPNVLPEFLAVIHALRQAVHARDDASAEEQRRVTAILQRALAEIGQGTAPQA